MSVCLSELGVPDPSFIMGAVAARNRPQAACRPQRKQPPPGWAAGSSTGRVMFHLVSLVIALGIGFACGYGLRELKSRRRRARALQRHFEILEQKRYDESIPERNESFPGA